ncbi:outer membrane scaffolding protein for murein synthesis (MipA/OmpV family) [Sphingobium sp. OAS761]|uniref:MipA/OmpV family protein n=1 Tax=Sphingobium sp. OAS761 TaxID=2817901 RepID=UPI0020A0EB2D|nr:MipA/OmpV family protein [Sphingobium sp. OAS761]MCP1468399.1 outer membrane scaffolding protein for murein synthesis (MipA/OmpV family) [Sphingobium sp. OAS761]
MHHPRHALAATVVATLSLATPALAQEVDESSLTIGAGIAAVPSYEGSDDYRVVPVPQMRGRVKGHSFWTRGTSLYVDAIADPQGEGWNFELGPMATVRLDRTSIKAIKDNAVRALGKRDVAVELGAFVGVGKTGVITSAYDMLSARVAVAKDVAGAHDSYVITPQIEYFTPLSRTAFVGLGVSADYVGKKYGRTYFDVTPQESVASGLPAYAGAGDGSGFKRVSFSLAGGKSLSGDLRKGWAIFAAGSYARMLGDYADSPVVSIAGSRNQWLGAIGIGYTF